MEKNSKSLPAGIYTAQTYEYAIYSLGENCIGQVDGLDWDDAYEQIRRKHGLNPSMIHSIDGSPQAWICPRGTEFAKMRSYLLAERY